ncbi:uncharacterized protein LOC120251320 [Dioscorea cayenensis subsp. rotundata]|uniref:Uncharacterized protein LOC120251320 n=1 Tax=Dioscorea cayennensis subsp. rotundata TaxID=55577 RepID=A0AB40ALC5_DIOCR|nr:uncharacterized protein LOC120251320 [Dioscorea cayenensis subsp. rotundata]
MDVGIVVRNVWETSVSINSTPPHRLRLHLSLSLVCSLLRLFLWFSSRFSRVPSRVYGSEPVCGEVSDLCIGKPALGRPLPSTATVGDALLASGADAAENSVNIADPARALADPVSVLLPKDSGPCFGRLEPNSGLHSLFLSGILGTPVVLHSPEKAARRWRRRVLLVDPRGPVRHFLNSIAVISSVAARPVAFLNVVRLDFVAVRYRDPRPLRAPSPPCDFPPETSVAVVTDDGKLIGEISPQPSPTATRGVAAASPRSSPAILIMAYIDCSPAPPVSAILAVKSKLKEKNLTGMLELLDEEFSQTLVMLLYPHPQMRTKTHPP